MILQGRVGVSEPEDGGKEVGVTREGGEEERRGRETVGPTWDEVLPRNRDCKRRGPHVPR